MDKPVVLGSSFSGVLVSLTLSKQGVDHILIGGDEPPDVPRLGESLNECASPELFGEWGREYPECFYTKSHISLLNGDFATQIHIANPRRCKQRMSTYVKAPTDTSHSTLDTLWASLCGKNLMHADRIRLDKALYHRALEQPQCEFIKKFVETVEVDDAAQRITRLTFQDGTSLETPPYVFDCTGFRSPVAKSAGVGIQPLSNEQRVVWAHQERGAREEPPPRWWRQGTNLLRLERDVDGIDGIAWLIPLGRTVSIGISVDNDKYPASEVDKEEVIRRLNDAYARRGVDYPELFPDRERPVMELVHRYYLRDRASGPNWLLVGGTYVSIWFPSSAGLWTVSAAMRLIPRILDEPEECGRRYEEALKPLTFFHEHLDKMIHGEPFRTNRDAYYFWATWLSGVPYRLGDYLGLLSFSRRKRYERYGFLKTIGLWYRRLPRRQMILWGFFVTRCVRQPDRSRQSDVFSGYFHQWPFRMRNYFNGFRHWLRLG